MRNTRIAKMCYYHMKNGGAQYTDNFKSGAIESSPTTFLNVTVA